MNNWNHLKPESKLWMYGGQRILTDVEQKQINSILDDFCENWAAHGAKLNCGFNIMYDRFIMIAVDEESAAASGCSIDKSIEVIKQIEAEYDLDLFNRLRCFHIEELPKTTITAYLSSEINELLHEGVLDENSKIVYMQATAVSDLTPNFTRDLKDTWLKKYLGQNNQPQTRVSR